MLTSMTHSGLLNYFGLSCAVFKAANAGLLVLEQNIPTSVLAQTKLDPGFSDLGFRCWSERQTSHRFGLEESFILELWRGRSGGADQRSGRGGDGHTHTHTLSFSSSPFVRSVFDIVICVCVQEVANRSTTYKATVEEESEEDDDDGAEENAFVQQVRHPQPRPSRLGLGVLTLTLTLQS